MEESCINNLPPGFRFHPTDEELISYYLTQKVSDFSFTSMAIIDVDLNKCEPWDLPAKASMGEKEWYFFNLRDRKYPTGLRTNRATEAGYWKTTGKDKEIFRGGVLVGMKKTLVFYKGRAPRGEKTNWVLHEYRLETNLAFRTTKEEWVVCRVFQKSLAMRKPQDSTPSHPSLDSPCDTNPITNDFGDIDQFPNLNSRSSITHDSLQNCMKLNNMNWPAAPSTTTLPSLSWPHTLLGSNLSMDALLLKAFSLYPDYKPSIMSTHEISHFGTGFSSHFPVPSSAKVLDALQQQLPPQEQPFSLDSIW